nr:hypothetical protein BaRGS_030063 [Batillaria attramentaria]
MYLKRNDLEKARKGLWCRSHKRAIELHCLECDELICIICQLTKHKEHSFEDMSCVYGRCQAQLVAEKVRLDEELKTVKEQLLFATKEQRSVLQKNTLVKENIQKRYESMIQAANRYRDEALASLDEVTDDVLLSLVLDLSVVQENMGKLTKKLQRVQQALDSKSGCELVTVAREIKCSEEVVQKLTTKQMTTVFRPVLNFSATPDATLEHMRNYIGNVAKMEIEKLQPEVIVVEQFRCGQAPDTEVYCVCPLENGRVTVSYERSCFPGNVVSQEFNSSGNVLETWPETARRVSWKCLGRGESMFVECRENFVNTFAKSLTPFCLERSPEAATVIRVEVISREPLQTNDVMDFQINCSVHRAFDAHVIEQLFVVLEEAQAPDLQRTVRLYRRPQPDAIATYTPPVAPFQPSDVCFYTLGGHEVLLVADELNDAIHVVNVQDGRLSFARYLAPGCPLLVQPTALNTDTRGRLWVACRGGSIFAFEPTPVMPA